MDSSDSTGKPPKKSGRQATKPKKNNKNGELEKSTLVVGLGASAGGVGALETFFDHLPENKPGITFVVVTHLSPDHESNLAEIIQRHTNLPVIQVTKQVTVAPEMVYVIPPGKQLSMKDGVIELKNMEGLRSDRAPIDLFFRTLAETHGDQAAAIVLSGTGSDGSGGIPRIKEMGGLTIAQDPAEAEYNPMPKSAISTGFIDQVLPVAQMGNWLVTYQENKNKIILSPPEAPGNPGAGTLEADIDLEAPPSKGDLLVEILAFLRVRTGHNFSLYKRSTLKRRIERRLQVNNITDLPTYQNFLTTHPTEVGALMRDLLISVTNFFRDKEVWDFVESSIIPRLFDGKDKPESVVRAWVAGCASGEEAYTLAILLHEYAAKLPMPPRIQIFASDLNENAINIAREGNYPESIMIDVSPERLRQHFTYSDHRYVVRKQIRESILFANHDLLKDPPFSRLDLISCRNLLIYLSKEAQEQTLNVFHFALLPEHFLLLGTSESADNAPLLFSNFDKKNHIYTSRVIPSLSRPVPIMAPNEPGGRITRISDPYGLAPLPLPIKEHVVLSPEFINNIMEIYAPPGIIVDDKFDIVYITNQAGRYLQFRDGITSVNLTKVIHPDLRLEINSGLYNAQKGNSNETRRIRLELDGTTRWVRLIFRPITQPAALSGYILIILDEIDQSQDVELPLLENIAGPDGADGAVKVKGSESANFAHQLQQEVEVLKSQLHGTTEQYAASVEELRASNEELKASNEELQSINEEMRSATEELETSREELQAVNEELITVNQELKVKIEEVSHSNSDLQNLILSTDIATIFLNRQLVIKRYTPKVERIFNIIPTDLNRPLAHLTHRLNYNDKSFNDDIEKVLRDLTPKTREVNTSDGNWYLLRILPYRTLEDRIDGVVLTFLEITERKRSEEALRESEERYRALVSQATAGVARFDLEGKLSFTNQKMQEILGFGPEEGVGKSLFELLSAGDGDSVKNLYEKLVSEGQPFEWEGSLERKDHSQIWARTSISPLRDDKGNVQSAGGIFIDISDRKRAEEELSQSEARFRLLTTSSMDALYRMSADWRVMLSLKGMDFLADTDNPTERWAEKYIPEKDLPGVLKVIRQAIDTESFFQLEHRVIKKDGNIGWVFSRATPLFDNKNQVVEWFGAASDIDARKKADEQAQRAAEFNVFRIALSDALGSVTGPLEILAGAMRVLGEFLKVNRVIYAEIEAGGETAVIQDNYVDGVNKLVGSFPLDVFERTIGKVSGSEKLVITNINTAPDLAESARQAMLSEGIQASLGVPLVKGGQWVLFLVVQNNAPKSWTQEEITAVEETAERTWLAMEQARSKEALDRNMEELTRFNRAMVSREMRMIELKKEINDLSTRLGEGKRYPLDFEGEGAGEEDADSKEEE